MNVKTRVYVSTHKKFDFPEDDVYIPVQVGIDEGVEILGYNGDNTGDNISFKHRYYSDLSTVYWCSKNSNADVIGVCHYRRYFVSRKNKHRENKLFNFVLNENEIDSFIEKCDIIIPKKRKYYIETIESHFKHTHTASDYEILRNAIRDLDSEYLESFEKVSASRSAHLFNCYIMKRNKFIEFCDFMFPILFQVEKKIDFSGRSEFESRTCGYLAEFLLDTWLIKNKYDYKEVRLKVLGGEKKFKKAFYLLKAKFFGKKYNKSF